MEITDTGIPVYLKVGTAAEREIGRITLTDADLTVAEIAASLREAADAYEADEQHPGLYDTEPTGATFADVVPDPRHERPPAPAADPGDLVDVLLKATTVAELDSVVSDWLAAGLSPGASLDIRPFLRDRDAPPYVGGRAPWSFSELVWAMRNHLTRDESGSQR